MAGNSSTAAAIFLILISLTACGPRRVSLPAGAGVPAPGFNQIYETARSACAGVSTIQAELGLSGRAGDHRVRGRVLAGIVPGALRLEGVAPFGAPVFILVADGDRGTLLLSRDRRVVRGAAPEEILGALVGISLAPDDLRALLSGCVKASADGAGGRAYGDDWLAVDVASGGTIYLHRADGVWRIVAGRYDALEVDYTEFRAALPAQIVLRGPDLSLTLGLDQVEVNGTLPRDQLVALKIPEDVAPLTLQELRQAGPLGR